MYGTVFHFRPLPGQEQAMLAVMKRWAEDRRPKVSGFVASYLYRSDSQPGEYVSVVVFEDRAAYERNANDAEQDQWYRQFRQLLEDDPAWNDGEVVLALQPGAPPWAAPSL